MVDLSWQNAATTAAITLAVLWGLVNVPLLQAQYEWTWLAAVLAVGVGDGATTASLKRFGLSEAGPLVRWLCGEYPSPRCAIGSRVIVLVPAGLVSLALVRYQGLRWWRVAGHPAPMAVGYVVPVALAAGGAAATLINLIGMAAVARRES